MLTGYPLDPRRPRGPSVVRHRYWRLPDPGQDLALEPEDRDGELHRLLVVLGPEHLVDRAESGGVVGAVEGVGEAPVAVHLHDLHLRPGAGQVLADDRIRRAAEPPGFGDDPVELAGEAPETRSSTTRPRSKPRVVMATFHPLLTPPTTFSRVQRASRRRPR